MDATAITSYRTRASKRLIVVRVTDRGGGEEGRKTPVCRRLWRRYVITGTRRARPTWPPPEAKSTVNRSRRRRRRRALCGSRRRRRSYRPSSTVRTRSPRPVVVAGCPSGRDDLSHTLRYTPPPPPSCLDDNKITSSHRIASVRRVIGHARVLRRTLHILERARRPWSFRKVFLIVYTIVSRSYRRRADVSFLSLSLLLFSLLSHF